MALVSRVKIALEGSECSSLIQGYWRIELYPITVCLITIALG